MRLLLLYAKGWKGVRMKTEAPMEKNRVVGGMLYLVSTPIGNLSDLSELDDLNI